MASSEQVTKFINEIAPIAQEQAKKHDGKLFASVCIAQACCESAYGTSPKMINANAVYGIKVGKSKYHFGTAWKGKAYSTKTKECYDGSTYVSITDFFRAYDNVSDSTEDYMDMLCTCSRYKAALNCSTPKASITAIKNGGYATSPTYISTITNIINKYNLTYYDNSTTVSSNPYQVPTTTLKYRSRGSGVRWLQYQLNSIYGLHLVVDGIFGKNTEESVMKFQREHLDYKGRQLVIDGKVGSLTRQALIN